jgi:hypothetical protein
MAKTGPRHPKRGVRPPERDILLTVRVTTAEMEAFKAAAEGLGLNLSSWARVLLRRGAGLPTI